jgi:hypothetical protein
MNDTETNGFAYKTARVISIIFHPLLIPVYGMVIILTAPTLYNFIPFDVKKILVLIMLVLDILLPLSLLPFFIHRNMISSWEITERKDRNIPLIISTMCYITTTYIFFRFPIPYFLKTYILAITFISLVSAGINFCWKISLHSVAAGALLALVMILSLKMYTPLSWFLIPVIIAGGLVMSSRLKLNLHNPVEVWIGYFTGVAGFSFVWMIF